MQFVAKYVVVAFSVFLLILAGVVFAKRALAKRFFLSFGFPRQRVG